jgi:hypothetical protein
MFGSGAVGLRRQFVLLSRFPVRIVHSVSSLGTAANSLLFMCTALTNLFRVIRVHLLNGRWRGAVLARAQSN